MIESHDPFNAILQKARALVDDRKLEAVKAWKAAHPGALAIGHMPVWSPRALVEGMGALPVSYFGGGDQVDVIKGDAYFQSYICHIPRSTIEQALAGDLDALDGMMFPAICDVIRNLGGMWKMLFPEKLSFYLDLPQNFDPAIGGKFFALELKRLVRELEKRGAPKFDRDRMRAAIADENERRAALVELDELRRKEPHRMRASEAYIAVRAGGMMTAKEHTAMLRALLDAAKSRPARKFDNVRVVLVGSFCEQPPVDLVVTLERSGCDIIDDDLQLGMRMIEGPIDLDAAEDPVDCIALAYLRKGAASASRYIADLVKGRPLVEKVRQSGAEGVVFAAASFCDPALLDQPMLEAALTKEGIPFTTMKFAENTGQFQVIREQAGAFSDSVKLWGAA
ncbi:MAG: 2-hydroxyacyl-CoA dehydratase [Deltaproteobacteria bacterium]|nr:2-hydroxyacyl-CoA dehydratase [Deltaproteobacteria bacterium]